MKFISDKGLDELKRYQYKSGGYTTIDNLMNGFWFGISERLPLVFIFYDHSGWLLI